MIKLFEQYNEYNQVKQWLDKMGVVEYTINDDLTVDIDGSVVLYSQGLSEIPVQFGEVSGNFECAKNKLTTLKGCPYYVGWSFDCSHNKLTTLEYSPKEVGENFICNSNELTTLKGMETSFPGRFNCGSNDSLPSLISSLGSIRRLLKYQDEYGIWDNDGSFNEKRFHIFIKDYEAGILN